MAAGKVFSAGSLLIKELLPETSKQDYDVHTSLDSRAINKLISHVITHSKNDSDHETINDINKLFFKVATDQGLSIPLDAFDNDSTERAAMLGEFEHKVNQINSQHLTPAEKTLKLNVLVADFRPKVEKQNMDFLLSKNSTSARMAQTGARGNAGQLMQGSSASLISVDAAGKPISVAITHSFAEGMSPAEHLAMSYGARGSTVLAQLSTALPGALFKKLTPNLFHEVITETDCGTHNGTHIPGNDKLATLGKYLAGPNRLVTEEVYNDIKHNKTNLLRSTLTCESTKGICAHCYGLAANGRQPEVGFNAGVIASQSVSEVLTQAMLGTKHSGGILGRKRNAYEIVNNILSNPESFQDEATISKLNGKVTGITKTELKDHVVHVNGVPHHVPNIQDLNIKTGDQVKIGQRLSTGTINPRELVGLVGFGEGRQEFANTLRESYGSGLDPRHFDIIAKNLMKYVRIDNPGSSELAHGDTVTVQELERHLREDEHKVGLHEAVGKTLSRKALGLTPGTTLTQNQVDLLAGHGIEHIHATKSGIRATPLVAGLQTSKLMDPNWVSKMSFNHIRDTIRDAAAYNHKSDIHSTDPIAPYVMGSEFGEGENGSY